MPRPRSLTHTDIATAALAVVDRAGLTALTMRAVAAELGAGTMSLYRYVTDREQLEGLVLDLALDGLDPNPPATGSWQRRITELADRVHTVMRAHPELVPLLLTRRHLSPANLRWGESVLGVLTAAGFTGRPRIIAFRALVSYVIGALQTEHLGPLSGPGTAQLAALPPEEYPYIVENASQAARVPADEEFRAGLAALLAGLTP